MEDLTTLNIERAEFYPRATKHIPEMVDLIKTLMQKGYAYRADDGSVYYDVSKFEKYGELSGIRPSQLVAGSQGEERLLRQGRGERLCALEGLGRGRRGGLLGDRARKGQARVAHRVLGDVDEVPR